MKRWEQLTAILQNMHIIKYALVFFFGYVAVANLPF